MAAFWERQPTESSKAYNAFLAYRDVGPERSIDVAYRLSLNEPQESRKRATGSWTHWARQFQWVARAQAYDDHLERVKEEGKEAEIRKIMSEGYAQTHERVKALNDLATRLIEQLSDAAGKARGVVNGGLWVKDYKGGDSVEVEVFASEIISQLRGVFDDLAKETGGRIRKAQTVITSLPKQYIGLEELTEGLYED